MADKPEHNHSGRLGLPRLAHEIQAMIARETIFSATNSAELGNLAAVNKTWQTFVEAETFRNIHVSLEATDETGAGHLIAILTSARLKHLKELTIDIEWPFFLRAQAAKRFSGSVAVKKMHSTTLALSGFIRGLHGIHVDPTARGLNLVIHTIGPAFVDPLDPNISDRSLVRRRERSAEIRSRWLDDEMSTLSPFQRRTWVSGTASRLLNNSPTVSIVTGLAFSPDFFAPSTMQILLSRFPNVASLRLDPMCGFGDPQGWRSDFFSSDLISTFNEDPAPKFSTLTLGRNPFMLDFLFIDPGSQIPNYVQYSETDPRLLAYIDALRKYTRNLKALRFDHFAAPTHFYKHFFTGMPGSTFRWEVLTELHIALFGNQMHRGKQVPMAIDDGAHLNASERTLVLELFYAAGSAAGKMPHLQKMTIHIPRHRVWYILAVTLQFAIQPRQDASLHGMWGSLGKLEFWATPRAARVEDVWRQSIADTRKKLQCIEWHSDECPDPMKGFGHWGKDMSED